MQFARIVLQLQEWQAASWAEDADDGVPHSVHGRRIRRYQTAADRGIWEEGYRMYGSEAWKISGAPTALGLKISF